MKWLSGPGAPTYSCHHRHGKVSLEESIGRTEHTVCSYFETIMLEDLGAASEGLWTLELGEGNAESMALTLLLGLISDSSSVPLTAI